MGNSNKYKKEKKFHENLYNSAIFGKHADIIEEFDYSNISMKSEVLKIDNNIYENLNSNENLIKSALNLSEDDNFLGEYKDDFKFIKLIKKDLIYKIYKAENTKDNRKVSLKVYNKKELEQGDYDFFLEQIKREEEIIKLCDSPYIINIYRKIETNDNIIFEMESWETNLYDYIKKNGGFTNKIERFEKILSQIIFALKILNEKGVMHRDIRPSNLFLKERDIVKLGGFDQAIYIKENTSESVGSYLYAAPEIIKNLEYDEKCDLWSLGITLYELLFNQLPYGKNVSINMIKQSIYYEDNFHYNKINDKEVNDLFKKLLTISPKNRINHKELFKYIDNHFNIFIKEEKEEKIKLDYKECSAPTEWYYVKKKIYKFLELIDEEKNDDYLNENRFMNKIMDIVEGGYLADIMTFPNGCVDSTQTYNNIIYYDENIKFINSINKDSDFFEKKTSGAFILCNDLESLSIIKEEILKQIKKDKRTTFNLITTGSTCEKVMNYLNENKEFFDCINNVCIYCMNINKYMSLKENYPKIHNDIYNKPKDVLNFINKYSDAKIKAYPMTKLITFQEYKDKYRNRHFKVSNFYGNINLDIYTKYFKRMKYLVDEEEQKNELKKEKKEIINGFKTFNLSNKNTINKNEDNEQDFEFLNKLIIKEYTKNTIYRDLNKWLMNSNKNFYESIAYFTARLMYSLNSYAIKNNKFFKKDKTTIYRGARIPYSCLLPYIRAKGKIIVLSSFTSTSESKKKALSFSGRNNSVQLFKTNLLFSVLFIIKNIWKNNWISNGINIQNESVYKEKEILYLPFSFYYLSDIKINLQKYTADIYLETIGKTQILEEEIKKGKEIVYNELEKIVEVKK
jgi:serine/threonine protein kinase